MAGRIASRKKSRGGHESTSWPYDDGHVHLPDARIEYEDRDGWPRREDIEVVTQHYRGAHAGAAAKSGFSCYRAIGGMVGGRGGGGRRTAHPRIAEDLLR